MLGALAIVCAARPLLERYCPRSALEPRRLAPPRAAVLVGYTARASPAAGSAPGPSAIAAPLAHTGRLPRIAILPSQGVQTVLDREDRAPDRRRPRRRPRLQDERARRTATEGARARGDRRRADRS